MTVCGKCLINHYERSIFSSGLLLAEMNLGPINRHATDQYAAASDCRNKFVYVDTNPLATRAKTASRAQFSKLKPFCPNVLTISYNKCALPNSMFDTDC